MTWTRTRPRVPGWYWYKGAKEDPQCVHVYPESGQYDSRTHLVVLRDGYPCKLDECRGQWAGPIEVPK